MAEERFLVVRLGSMGDIVHTLPAVAALREAFPRARVDWVVEAQWLPLLHGNPDVDEVIPLERGTWDGLRTCVKRLRAARYTCALDFQGLYKSAMLAALARARERIGFEREFLREGGAAFFYTRRITPSGKHVVELNVSLAEAVGAKISAARFSVHVPDEADGVIEKQLAARGVRDFYVLSPGGGWRSKCWPAERYGHLHRRLAALPALAGWRGVVNFGPAERKLAEAARLVAGEPEPILLPMDVPQLMALLRRAKFFVGGDSGPLHLAVALGTPVVGLYGPTDPARNGPYSPGDVVVRNARPEETTYKREDSSAPSMLSITVDQALAAIQRRMGIPA